jgi:ribosomal protein S7
MIALIKKHKLSDKYLRSWKLKLLLITAGKKERTTSILIQLLTLIKQSFIMNQRSRRTQNRITPIDILDKCLYELMPAFYIRNTYASGKLYNLPVATTPNRASFTAANWLKNSCYKNDQRFLKIASLLHEEINAVLLKKGSSIDCLNSYINIAIDQRPFSRYINRKKKRGVLSFRKKRFKKLRNKFIHQRLIKKKKRILTRKLNVRFNKKKQRKKR